jgi:Ser/Thr protein kinase RdoA (MazF antagonist)
MFLTEANVLHYLLEKQFGEIEAVVAGRFTVRSLTRRNVNLHVTWGALEYLVKQTKERDTSSRASIEREASFYRQRQTGKLRTPLLPQCYAYDPPNSLLILEFLSGHKDLREVPDRFAPELGRLCGETLGTFHREMESGSLASAFPGFMPSCLSSFEREQDPASLSNNGRREPDGLSKARQELLRVVKRHPEFDHELSRLRAEWYNDTLTHGDCKLENFLISPDRTRLRIIDWEYASWSDSIWDVGGMLQSWWNFWIRRPSAVSLATVQPALRAFLAAYASSRGIDPADLAARAVRFAGARMLQTAFETLRDADAMTGEAVRLLQGSFNILTRPDWALGQLIGPLRNLSAHA